MITWHHLQEQVSACLCRTQDVRREMAAFVPTLWSQIREGKQQSVSVVRCETQTNALHEATDQTDHDSVLQQQVFVLTFVLTWH